MPKFEPEQIILDGEFIKYQTIKGTYLDHKIVNNRISLEYGIELKSSRKISMFGIFNYPIINSGQKEAIRKWLKDLERCDNEIVNTINAGNRYQEIQNIYNQLEKTPSYGKADPVEKELDQYFSGEGDLSHLSDDAQATLFEEFEDD